MTTRLYLDATADTVPISPTPDSDWEDTSLLTRVLTDVTPSGENLSTVSFSNANNLGSKDILFRQYISPILTAGQAISGSSLIVGQCRVSETFIANNVGFTIGIRIIDTDGTTVKATLSSVFRDSTEAVVGTLTNRHWQRAGSVSYTTETGDRLCLEIGMGGTPGTTGSHSSSMRLGSASGTDLAEDDTETTDNNPWIELPYTLTFVSGTDWTDNEADTITLGDAEVSTPVSAQSDSVTLASDDASAKTVIKALSDSVTMSDQAQTPSAHFAAFEDALTLADAMGQTVQLALSDSFTVTDTIIKSVVVARSDVLLLGDVMTRSLHLDDTLTLTSAARVENPDTTLAFHQLPAFFGTIR